MINNLGPAAARRLVPAHAEAPLFDCLRQFVERDQAPFFSPGHKGGRSLDPWFRENIAAIDLNNLPDTDTLHCPSGPIAEAEQLIADAWGAAESFMLVQGSTSGNIAMALCTLKPGDKVVVQGQPGRNPADHRIRLVHISRPADGWEWGGDFE